MNEDIERFNEQNRKINQGPMPGDFSQASHSSITSPDEDKRSMAQGIIDDLSNQRADIDKIMQALQAMSQQINGITQALNQGIQPASTEAKPLDVDKLAALGDFAEKAISAYKSLRGGPPQAAPLIDQEFINKRMVQSFMDDLDTGTSITNFIKDSLKKKVTKEVINKSLSDMGKDTHEPQ